MSIQKRREEELFARYPNYKSYTECQKKAFLGGTFTFATAASGLYVAQELLRTRLPYPRTSFTLPSVVLGSIAAYVVTRYKTKQCQDLWMALEEEKEEREMSKEMPSTGGNLDMTNQSQEVRTF